MREGRFLALFFSPVLSVHNFSFPTFPSLSHFPRELRVRPWHPRRRWCLLLLAAPTFGNRFAAFSCAAPFPFPAARSPV